ncbi:hypothetical protein M9Y10_024296 [Tritrichomonas musculus]|uniref:DUF3447 domain-containing protein n=1 Tax=Tritrichomonas musculus TaxID=1915356 RepID=A0ABR2HCI7_9EUKA
MSTKEIEKYISSKKEFIEIFYEYIDDQIDFDVFLTSIQSNIILKKEEIKQFLRLLIEITNNHHRNPTFIDKIQQILIYIKNDIQKQIPNLELFKLSKNNKLMLLFLINNQIITLNEEIAIRMFNIEDKNHSRYCLFFYPEIMQLIDKEKQKILEEELSKYNINNLINLKNKRQKGENDSYICSLIQNDCIEEFVAYHQQSNISLNDHIEQSTFETNPFLIKNKPTLIEYAAFFGSIQIIRYLMYNQVELTSSIWIYAIHSNNPDLIHILEENHIEPPDNDYERYFIESIKCHHNNIGNYILDLYLNNKSEDDYSEKIIKIIFKSQNYQYLPRVLNNNKIIYYLHEYGYINLLNLYLETKQDLINQGIITIHFIIIF